MKRFLLRMPLLLLAVWMLYGCSSNPPVHADAYSVTLEHEEDGFREAMNKAKEHCRSQGKTVETRSATASPSPTASVPSSAQAIPPECELYVLQDG